MEVESSPKQFDLITQHRQKASAAKTKAVWRCQPVQGALRNLNSRVDMQAN